MTSYFDSSVILSIILDEERQSNAINLWNKSTEKISSILLRIETLVSLRRHYEHNKHKLNLNWLAEKTSVLNEYLDEVDCLNISKIVEDTISNNISLSKCRSLDAIHLATAIIIKINTTEGNINFYTFDENMNNVARDFGFIVNVI